MAKKFGSIDSSISYWAMAATILFSLTFSAHTNIHDTLLLAVAAMLTLLPRTDAEPAEKSLWLKIWCLLLITYPITSWLLILPQVANAFFRIPFFVLMVIMSVCALCQFEKIEIAD